MTQKATFKKIIDLDAKKVVSAVKIINLDTEVFIKKIIVIPIFEIDDSSIYIAMTLIN